MKDRIGWRNLMPGIFAIIVMLWSLNATANEQGEEHVFVGSQKCATCHKKKLLGRQFAVWKAGPHAKAFETLGSDRAADFAEAAGIEDDPQEADECLRCHVTGYGLSAERFARRKPILEDGVGCESCHGAGKDFRNEKVMSDFELAKSKGLKIPTDADCRVCHNDESPAWDPEKFVLSDGSHAGFDFDQAVALIAHPIPAEVKGHYLELKKKK